MSGTGLPDEDVARRIRRGDRDAFDLFFDRFGGPLLGYLTGMAGEPALAEDLLQETLLRVYRNIGRYRERGLFRAWVFRIATNLALSHLRRRRLVPLAPLDERALQIPDRSRPAPHEALESEERARWIDEGIETLPADQRTVFLLRVRHDLVVREIAAILCVPEGTVKSRFHHAVRKLRDHVERRECPESEENRHDGLCGGASGADRARVRRAR